VDNNLAPNPQADHLYLLLAACTIHTYLGISGQGTPVLGFQWEICLEHLNKITGIEDSRIITLPLENFQLLDV
jgi:hypothetical protein